MTIAAAEVAVGLAIVIAVYRLRHGVDADAAGSLKERDLGDVPPISPEGRAPPQDDHAHDAHGPDAHGPDAPGHDAHGSHPAAAEAHR